MSEFSSRIRQHRKQSGLTQSQLAERVGITQAYLAEIEKGRKRPSLEVLEKLCDELGCSADYLLGITQSRNLKTLRQESIPGTLLQRGITPEMLAEIEARNITGKEFKLALNLIKTMKEQ